MEPISASHGDEWLAQDGGRIRWGRWAALVFVAIAGSLFYGASLGLVLSGWEVAASALWLALSAGLAWCVLIPVLCWVGRVGMASCFDACLVSMAFGEIVLTAGALVNGLLWWRGAVSHAVAINVLIVGISNVVMAVGLAHRLRPHGVASGRVWIAWMLALNGSGAVFFCAFYHWLHHA
jgi:hypothetical protein